MPPPSKDRLSSLLGSVRDKSGVRGRKITPEPRPIGAVRFQAYLNGKSESFGTTGDRQVNLGIFFFEECCSSGFEAAG